MYYLVYKTTNIVNKKFYIGMHQSETLADSYLGSGTILKKALKKYGRCNFKREIIAVCLNTEVARSIERQMVRYSMETFGRNCYNRAFGGIGACAGEDNAFFGRLHKDSTKQLIGKKASERYQGEGNPFFGRHHSKETKEKLRNRTAASYDNCEKMRVGFWNKIQFWYCTPFGSFFSTRYASKVTGIPRNCIISWCKNPTKFVNKAYNIPEKYWGRTWRENGFYRVSKGIEF